jgi:hypothetical protein
MLKNVDVQLEDGDLILTIACDGDESRERLHAANREMALGLCERMFAGNEFLASEREAVEKLAVADKQLRSVQRTFDQARLDHEVCLDGCDMAGLPGAKAKLVQAETDLASVKAIHSEATARLRKVVSQTLSGDRSQAIRNAMYAEFAQRVDAGKAKLTAAIRELEPVIASMLQADRQERRVRERVSSYVRDFIREKLVELLGEAVVVEMERAPQPQHQGQPVGAF